MIRQINTNFAEILGLLCAEGCHVISYSNYWETERGKPRYRKNKKSERIEFYNKNDKLLLHFKDLLDKEFKLKPKITKHNKINIANKEVIKKIITQTELGHLSWKIPSSVMKGNINVKIAFLRGFFDGDGTAINVARFFSTNEGGIKQLSILLTAIGVLHTIQKAVKKEGRKPLHSIQISRKDYTWFINTLKPIAKQPKNKKDL